MAVRILIADDHEVIREGVGIVVKRLRPEWEICGEARNGEEAISEAKRLRPDVVLLDITMPKLSGLQAAPQIAALKASKILMFTMHDSAELANDAKRAGAQGYVTKSDASRYLITAIEAILAGGTFFGKPEASIEDRKRNPNSGITFRLALGCSLGY